MEEEIVRRRFDLKTVRILRLIQTASLLPLILIGSFMIYFREISPFGILAFLLVLVIGVIIPETRRDIILSHFLLTKELEQRIEELRAEMTKPKGHGSLQPG